MNNVEKAEKLISLFPMAVLVTKEMIEDGGSNLCSIYKCIGALTLRKGLGSNKSLLPDFRKHIKPSWGITESRYTTDVGDVYLFTSHDSDGKEVDMTELTEPCTITLKFQYTPTKLYSN